MRFFKGLSSTTTDQELIKKYKQTSDLDYIAELYKRYLHLIYGVTLKYLKVKEDAEDLSIKIFEVLRDKVPTQEIENVGGWLHTVTKNECLMHLRSVARAQKKEDEYASFMEIDTSEHQNNEIDIENDLNKLKKCLDSLVKEQKECINLFYKQEKCYREVANLTGYQLKKVKSYLQNGKRNLAICMGSNNG
jgi:RNA polymerase sigma-70 factor, ECF subfamily